MLDQRVIDRARYPDATESDLDKLDKYRRGAAWECEPPPVCTALWDELSWARYVTFLPRHRNREG